MLTEIWKDRAVLQSVKTPSEEVSLTVVVESVKPVLAAVAREIPIDDDYDWPDDQGTEEPLVEVLMRLRPSTSAVVKDRTLYSLALRLPHRRTFALAPHALYTKNEWKNFGFVHATDLHVSRRVDDYHRRLIDLGRNDSVAAYNNYNDGLRDTIRYANHLHDIGMIDFILATGDLVDYQFDDGGDERLGGGNFLYLERLIRGDVTRPSGAPVEALHVPIFMTLGNHDYRPNPYKLLFYADVPIWSDPEFTHFEPHNLTREDAIALQGGHPTVSGDTALGMVKVDRPDYHLAPSWKKELSYVLKLGSHRIVMLDSKHDLGVLENGWDVFKTEVLGIGNEDKKSFADGAPNQVGFETYHLPMVADALAEAGDKGIVVVGVHGPPLNVKGEFPHYLRETEHPTADKKDVINYLIRQAPLSFPTQYYTGQVIPPPGPPAVFLDPTTSTGRITRVIWEFAETLARDRHPGWMNTIGQRHFMKGTVGDLLDADASKGKADDFLKLCAGVSTAGLTVTRPVDVVLCGHGHNRVEYRLHWERTKNEMRYFTDFYTENPSVYYGSRKAAIDFGQLRVAIRVQAGSPPNGQPRKNVQDHRWDGEEWTLDVPPYPHPLASASDKVAWWETHSPLILQTGGTGPMESRSNDRHEPNKKKPDPSFQGFRWIWVSGSHISAMRYVTLSELRKGGFKLPWERASVQPVEPPKKTS